MGKQAVQYAVPWVGLAQAKPIQLIKTERALVVYGASMLPNIWPGTRITLVDVRYPLHVGDLVFFIDPSQNRKLLHRIVAIEQARFLTQGDSCPKEDGWIEQNQILATVKGLVVGRWNWQTAPRWLVRLCRMVLITTLPITRRPLMATIGLLRSIRNAAYELWLEHISPQSLPTVSFELLSEKHLEHAPSYLIRRNFIVEDHLPMWEELSKEENSLVVLALQGDTLCGSLVLHKDRDANPSVKLSHLHLFRRLRLPTVARQMVMYSLAQLPKAPTTVEVCLTDHVEFWQRIFVRQNSSGVQYNIVIEEQT